MKRLIKLLKLLSTIDRLLIVGLLTLVFGITFQGFHFANDYEADSKHFLEAYHENVTSLSGFHGLNGELEELRLQLSSYGLSSIKEREKLRKARIETKNRFDLLLKTTTENLLNCENEKDRLAAFNEFKIEFAQYWATQSHFFTLVDQGRTNEAWDYRLKVTNPLATKANATLKEILKDESLEAAEQAKLIEKQFITNSHANWVTVSALTLFALGISFCLIFLLVKTKYEFNKSNLIHDNRLALIAKSTASIAHEINTPLTIINGKLEILLKKLARNELMNDRLETDLQVLQKHTNRVLKISHSLRIFSRREAINSVSKIDLNTIIEDSIEMAQHSLHTYSVALKTMGSIPNVQVEGNEIQITQILVNLINNASQAISKLNERWIDISFQIEETHSTTRLHIFVTDSGSGIPVDVAKSLFTPFYTTKDTQSGTGLGLSISKEIAKNHGGDLRLVPGTSHTQFQITLPCTKTEGNLRQVA